MIELIKTRKEISMRLDSVTKTYTIKDASPIHAIKDITITLPNQGMVFFTGKSGSGKSTLLNLLGGLDRSTSGFIDVNGKNISSLSNQELDSYRSQHVGFIFQELNLIETLSVKENIALSLELNQVTYEQERIEEALSIVDLEGYTNRMPNTLSGGQRQRVAIARALIKSPKVILADEPTGSLDSETAVQIFQLLKELSKSNLVIVVSHDLDYAHQFGDRIIELKDGIIIFDSNPSHGSDGVNQVEDNNHNVWLSNKVSLPTKRSIQLGYHYLKLKKWKLILTMIITLSTFILFGLFDALGSYEVTKNSVESMYDQNQTNVFINQMYQSNLDDTYGVFMHMSFDHIRSFEEKYPHSFFIPVMRQFNLYYEDSLFDYEMIDTNLFATESLGGISISPEILDSLGYDIVYGNLPTQTNQVLISLHAFQMYDSYDYRTSDHQRIEINQYQDIIGLTLLVDNMAFEVVGIIDTHLDLSKFERLFDNSKLNTIERITLLYEYNGLFGGGLHQHLFMHEDVITEYEETNNNVFNLSLASAYTTMTFQTSDDLVDSYMLEYIAKMTISNKPESIIWLDEEIIELSSNQVILPIYAITNNPSYSQEILIYFNQLIDQFVNENFAEIQAEFEANETGSYNDFIRISSINPYHPGYTMHYFYHQALENWIDDHYQEHQNGQMIISGNFGQSYDIELVGFYDDILSDSQYPAYTSGVFFNEVIETHHLYPLYGAIAVLSSNRIEDHKLIDEVTNLQNQFYFIGTNPILTTALIYEKVLSDFSAILLYIGIILALVSTLQLFNMITSSISMKKKEIGILRAIGARMKDVMKIFYSEALMIGLFSAILAILLNVVIITSANQFFMTQYGTSVKLLIFGYRQVVIIVLMVLISATLSTLLPVYFYAKKNPIDTIRLS